MELLREKLLAGRRIVVGGAVPAALLDALRDLGAEVESIGSEEPAPDEDRVGGWAKAHAPLDALVYGAWIDQRTDAIWATVREVAVGALIPGQSSGKVVLIGPGPGPRGSAGLRAALESLARTLSVEWARYGVSAVMVAPGHSTTDEQLAAVVCFAVSEAGSYLSGCRLELGATG